MWWHEKYCWYKEDEYLLQEEEQILLQEVDLVLKEKIIILSHRKIISCNKAELKIIPVTENVLHVMHTVLIVIGWTFFVTWWNKPMSPEKLSVTRRILHVTKGRIFSSVIKNISYDRKFISCDRNNKEHLMSPYIFLVNKRTPCFTWRIFHCAGDILSILPLTG